ncbi:MAG: alpha/beta hydrolase [Pseudomonadota bacterium]
MMLIYALAAALLLLFLATLLLPEQFTRLGLAAERRLSGLETRQAWVDGFDMPYLEGGKGEALVLIHGFGGDKDNFTRIARFLTPHYRVIIPDLPGFGDASRDPAASYTMSEQVARVHALLAQLGVGRAHLGGNSMGGFIAAQYAATLPEQVATVWLLDPAGTAASHSSPMLQHYEKTGENPLLVRTVADFDKTISSTTFIKPFLPRFVIKAMARRAVADFALHTRIMRQLSESTLLETRYQALATPALIVWGAQDQILSPAGVDAFRRLFPDSAISVMKDTGHLPMLERPKQTARDYLAWRVRSPHTVLETTA